MASAVVKKVMGPFTSMGEFFALSAEAFRGMTVWPFQWKEFLDQCWFIVRVSLVPTLLVALPFTALISFTFNILAAEFGASDIAGAGATLGAVTQIGPVVTVLVVAGAGATAICADLGSRTIREEIDAMEVLGIDPIVRLVSPRILASMLVALLLNALVCTIGIVGSFIFSVYFQNVTPGAFVDGIPLLTGLPELVISEAKAGAFGLIAALIACYRGLTVKGGPKSVGQAVNETVVYAFMALFVVNVVMTAVGIKMTAGS